MAQLYSVLDTRISVFCPSIRNSRATPPERGGLESSGKRIISSFGKTKRIAFCFRKKKHFQNFRFLRKKWFFSSDLKKNSDIQIFLTCYYNFHFFGFLSNFLRFFLEFCGISQFVWGSFSRFFLEVIGFLDFSWIFFLSNCLDFIWFFSKLLSLLLKENAVTTKHQKLHKIG